MQIVYSDESLHEISESVFWDKSKQFEMLFVGDNLSEIPEPVFWEKLEKYHVFVICWICPETGDN